MTNPMPGSADLAPDLTEIALIALTMPECLDRLVETLLAGPMPASMPDTSAGGRSPGHLSLASG